MVNGLSLVLAPLHRAFGIESITVVTMQAISGAGRSALTAYQTAGSAAAGNVVPAIANEAPEGRQRAAQDSRRQLPSFRNGQPGACGERPLGLGVPQASGMSALAAATEALQQWRAPEAVRALPSCPHRPVAVSAEPDAPNRSCISRRQRHDGDRWRHRSRPDLRLASHTAGPQPCPRCRRRLPVQRRACSGARSRA